MIRNFDKATKSPLPSDFTAVLTQRKLPVWFAIILMALLLSPVASASPQDEDAALRIYETATLAQNNSSYDFALSEWDKLLSQHANSTLAPKANYYAGICTIQTTQYEKAIGYLKAAAKSLDNESGLKEKASLFLGFAQYRHGLDLTEDSSKKQESTTLLTTATQTFTNLLSNNAKFDEIDQAYFFQGEAFEALGRDDEALKSYTKMLALPEQKFRYEGLLAAGDIEAKLGQFKNALVHYEKFRELATQDGGHPKLSVVNLETGRTLIRIGANEEKNGNSQTANDRFQEAAKILAPVADQDQATLTTDDDKLIAEEARFQQAFCESRLGQFAKSAQLYEAVASNPKSSRAIQSLANAGRNYLNAGDAVKATAVLEKAAADDSDYGAQAAHWLADEVYLRVEPTNPKKAYDLSTRWIGKLKPDDPSLVPLKIDQANATYAIPERRKESVGLFQAIADQYPNHALAPMALYNSAYGSLDIRDYNSAISKSDAFEKSYGDSDYLADTLEVKADASLLNEQPEVAEKVFEQLVSKFADNDKVSFWKLRTGVALFLQKKYQPTIDKLSPLVDLFSDPTQKAEALHWVGSSQFHLKDYANASESLSRSNQLNNKWRRADETLLMLCRSQLANKQSDAGKKTATGLIAGFPQSPLLGDLYYHLGRHAYENEKFEEAFDHFEQINKNYADSKLAPYALYDAAWSQMELKKFNESEKLFATLMSKFPNHELAKKSKVGRGASLRKTGNTEASIAELKDFLKMSNPSGEARTNALFEIGLNQVELKKWDDAIGTFKMLIAESADSPKLDRFYYELAWAYRSKSDEKLAIEFFTKITTDKPESSLAGESNFHVGTAAYDAKDYAKAIKSYEACLESKAADNVREKASYKLAWAYYKQKQFQAALDSFTKQTTDFPKGELVADGMFMVAESHFRLKDHAKALDAYLAAKPIVDASKNVEPKIKWLTLLHGAQSANNSRVKKYDQAIELASEMEKTEADDTFQQDAWLELGTAYSGLKQSEQAMEFYRKAAKNLGRTGARARCMIGDIHFGNKNFADAGNEFRLVYFGFGGPQAPDDVKPWQAYAIYESARCSFVQVDKAPKEAKRKLIDESIRQFEYLIKNYPDDKLAPEAKRQLVTLKKLKVQ